MHRCATRITASMSQNNLPTIHTGLDIAKATLQLSLRGTSHALDNDTKGHARLIKLLGSAERESGGGAKAHVILEATGGYEAAVVRSLHQAGILVSVMMPSRIRAFARAKGQLAKTDPIDADMLTAFGEAIKPEPTAPKTAAQSNLGELTVRRAQLVAERVAEENRAALYTGKIALQQSRQLVALLGKQIGICEKEIAAQIAAEPEMKSRAERLQEVPGVGPISAAILLAQMPELGTLSDGEAAALAGLAPYNCDSGTMSGTRHIRGGRVTVRCALYMAAMSAVRHDRILREFYQRLCAAGKKPIIALTAAMRKLIVLLNRLLKKPDFQLQG